MHLLVLSAFRPDYVCGRERWDIQFQCTFWCSVLSDPEKRPQRVASRFVSMHLLVLSAFRQNTVTAPKGSKRVSMHLLVLSAFRPELARVATFLPDGFNAPFGAQCFPTQENDVDASGLPCVSMHLLVLSAFRLVPLGLSRFRCRVSMHLLVLSAFRLFTNARDYLWQEGFNAPFGAQCFPTLSAPTTKIGSAMFQCTFWCSVLSDVPPRVACDEALVSMHLLVLSAFRPELHGDDRRGDRRFNAPFGAQCFPTASLLTRKPCRAGFNAPFGAQCFPTANASTHWMTFIKFQCTFWCSVLSDPPPESRVATPFPGTKTPPTWKAPNRIGSHRSN